jgi:hypothetical protein
MVKIAPKSSKQNGRPATAAPSKVTTSPDPIDNPLVKKPFTIWMTEAEKDRIKVAAGRLPLSPFIVDRVLGTLEEGI